jgi:hypothetical protein
MRLLIDPPVTSWSSAASIREWMRELEAMRTQHLTDSEALACIERADEDAKSMLESAQSRPKIRPPPAAW